MNAPIVNDTFLFVKWLYKKYLPHGFSDLQLDEGMDLKNLCTSIGLRKNLDDRELELIALAALLHNTGSIEGEYNNREVSQAIAKRYLDEKKYPTEATFQVLACIAATQANFRPNTRLERFINAAKFSFKRSSSERKKRGEVGDLWP